MSDRRDDDEEEEEDCGGSNEMYRRRRDGCGERRRENELLEGARKGRKSWASFLVLEEDRIRDLGVFLPSRGFESNPGLSFLLKTLTLSLSQIGRAHV